MTTATGKPKIGAGIFGVKNRELYRVLDLQTKFMKSLSLNLKKLDNYNITKNNDLMDLLQSMLMVDPAKRISPKDIINHPFCKTY